MKIRLSRICSLKIRVDHLSKNYDFLPADKTGRIASRGSIRMD